MPEATFRFYEELNDLLPMAKRKKEFSVSFPQGSTVKDVLASLGVPHTQVDLILINGEAENFSFPLKGGERVSAYPVFESFDIRSVRKPGSDSLRQLKFVADVHLGKLAKYMRLFGFEVGLCSSMIQLHGMAFLLSEKTQQPADELLLFYNVFFHLLLDCKFGDGFYLLYHNAYQEFELY